MSLVKDWGTRADFIAVLKQYLEQEVMDGVEPEGKSTYGIQ